MRAQIRELATGLMALTMSLPLIAGPGASTQLDGASGIALTVTGSPGSNAGLTVAIPVSGGSDKPVAKPVRRAPVRQKHTGS